MTTARTGELYVKKTLQRALLLIGQKEHLTGDAVAEAIIESYLEAKHPKLLAALKGADEDWMRFQKEQQSKLEASLNEREVIVG